MRILRFLRPTFLRFTWRLVRETLTDRVLDADPLPIRVRDYVAAHASPGDPGDVLATMDRYAREVRFLMNLGPEKGPLVQELLADLPRDARILELGAFCGYSSIMLASTLGPEGRIISVEKSGASVEGARANVEHAGLADRIEIVHGPSTQTIPELQGPFDLVFLDHWKDLYRQDLEAIERHELLRPGSIVVADNVGPLFGAHEYLDYVRNCGRYRSEHRESSLEYSTVPDAVEISIFRP